jgi:ribosome recycling factor
MYEEYESKMKKSLAALLSEFATVRAGRANAAVLDQVRVDYYGEPTPIAQIAAVSIPDPRTLVISPWDASVLKHIEKAIQTSELGINPTNDGKVIRLAFPQLTEDRRRELTKQVAKYAEEAKVAIRNIRRDAVETFKAQKKRSEITEDDLKDTEKDLQKLTDVYIKEIDKAEEKKAKELLEI